MYIEYSQFLQQWLDDGLDPSDVGRKGNNWGLYAPWVFAEHFDEGEKQLRDGFVAFAAAKYESDFERAQRLLFQSTVLLATHEQSGVHPFLEPFDIFLAPAFAEGWFAELEMGLGRDLELAIDLHDQFGLDPTGVRSDFNNTIWDTDVLDLDPAGMDASVVFEAPGLDITFGGSDPGVLNLIPIGGVPTSTPSSCSAWRLENGGPVADEGTYVGVRSTAWSDWEERQWFLLNLFRTLHADDLVRSAPSGRGLGSSAMADFDALVSEVLRIVV